MTYSLYFYKDIYIVLNHLDFFTRLHFPNIRKSSVIFLIFGTWLFFKTKKFDCLLILCVSFFRGGTVSSFGATLEKLNLLEYGLKSGTE